MSNYTVQQAVRFLNRITNPMSRGFAEARHYAAKFDAGEWSSSASSDKEEEEAQRVLALVADKTGVDATAIDNEDQRQQHLCPLDWA